MNRQNFPDRIVKRLRNIRDLLLGLLIVIASLAGYYEAAGSVTCLFAVSGLLGSALIFRVLQDDENYYQ
jgi:hypothetical protein